MKEIVVGPERRLVLRDAAPLEPLPHELVVRVKAISLNRGEVRLARLKNAEGYRPGWDLAGVVETPAGDGSGPKAGTRVVGIVGYAGRPGSWAECVAVPTRSVAELPADVPFEQAACLPVAGLTALMALDKRGSLLGRRVLVTGATGGVGHLATQLAHLAGAQVVAVVRQQDQVAYAKARGADQVAVVGEEPHRAAAFGPFDLILDSVGGASAGAAFSMLAPDGVCVLFGASESTKTSFDLQKFYFSGGGSVRGLVIFDELARGESASHGFGRLLPLVSAGRLKSDIGLACAWSEVDTVAERLMRREFSGKAVLLV